ncbi:MAG TPA: M56 family metallopeptidase [Thermoanaerobaculia bacterium]|jgi:beta-lactamase regulating signal transducer with metallopeptidase domain|nr:M56 family metallopeptidase [Thermoanaerobaculia bacterium]
MTSAVASFLFAAAWKGTLLVAFTLVVHRVARNHVPSRWLCALLLIGIVRLLVPVGPSAPFSVFNLVSAGAPPPPMKIAVDDVGRASARLDGLKPVVRAAPAAGTRWTAVLLALWAAGVAFVITRAAVLTRRFQQQLADSVDVDRDDVLTLVDECRGILNVTRRVRVRITDAVATPALHGWLRPTLLLPQGFLEAFTRAQLRYVVLHELAHLRRSDVLVNWIAAAAHALHWFNPLVRLAVARLAEERELACDALALAALRAEERPAYGGTVLEMVDRMRAAPAVPALVGMTASPQQLKRRIVMIASFRQSRHSLLFAALVVAIGLLTLTDARAGEPMKRQRMKVESESAAIREVMEALEKPISAEFKESGIEDILHGVMNATGISVVFEDGALDDATRAKRLNIKATNVPAHLILFESLGTLDLAVRVTETGVLVLREPEEVVLRKIREAENGERMFMRKAARSSDEPQERIEVIEEGERGGGKRKITLRTDGQVEEGTLEISLIEKK